MNFIIRKAERKQAKLRLALIGVAGCGKTTGAINIAAGMGGKTVIIDTERKSADLFCHLADYDVLDLEKPFTPEKYIKAIHQCESSGYEIIIIDSLSHSWSGEGGVLDMQDNATKASVSKNSYMAWREVTPWHNKLIDTMLQSSAHIIVTMRAKTQYEVINENGKLKPVKIGLAPVQRDGMDYEFTTVLDIDKESHLYSSSKDRTQLFEGKHEQLSRQTGEMLIKWLNDGRPLSEIEKDEIKSIKNKMLSSTLEELRNVYSSARKKYPHRELELLHIANERKSILEKGEIH